MANQIGINSTLESLRQSYNDTVVEIDEIKSDVDSISSSVDSISQEQQNRVYVKSITITEDSIVVTKGDGTVETLEVPGKIDPTAIVVGIKGDAETTYRTGNVNITPANIGAAEANHTHNYAAADHTHNYAGSTSAGGAANSALTATKATQDSAGQPINSTYIKEISISGTTITITKGDGATSTLTTQDTNTVYSLPVASSTVRGGVKVGYSANGKNYPVQLTDEKMYVNVPWTDTNTTYSVMAGSTASAAGTTGLVPAPAAGAQTKYLRGDGTWQTPPDTNTTYANMKAATTSAAGSAGLVPAPAAGAANRYLRSDGTWTVPPNTTYGAVSSSANGLATPSLLSTANNAVPKSGATMTGALIGKANANYTTAQFRNVTMSTSAPSGGSNGQIHFQYT